MFMALGQRIQVKEVGEGFEYTVIYDYYQLFYLFFDMTAKSLMFYSNQKVILSERTRRQKFTVLSIIFILTLLGSLFIWWIPSTHFNNLNECGDFLLGKVARQVVFYHLLVFFASIGYSFYLSKKADEKIAIELKQKNIESELKLLKSQINPHFLFNTLNNIYAMVSKNADIKTAKTIGQLSRLLRYTIYESNSAKVPLAKEIELINDYLNLQKNRLVNPDAIKCDINFKVDIMPEIPHMLLITFVENAFIHGLINDKNNLNIDISIDVNEFSFSIENNIDPQKNNNNFTGIGLENAKKRLDLIYGRKYDLTIDHGKTFIVNLKIRLND
jgi:two-component system LytT family sensor kinase